MTNLRLLALGFVAFLGSAGRAPAACNVIPGPSDQLSPAELDATALAIAKAVDQENRRFGGLLPYKGALGRIDRVYLTPARADAITVAADGRCIRDEQARPFALESVDHLVAAMVVTTAAGPSAQVTTGGGLTCEQLTAAVGHEPPAQTGHARLKIGGCTVGGITPLREHPQTVNLRFPAAAGGAAAARIVVLRAESADDAARQLESAATTNCAALCGAAAHVANLGACIDAIYAPIGLSASQTLLYAQDMVKCSVMNTPSPIPWNDFAAQCQNGTGSQGLPQCGTTPPDTLALWEDECHGIYVPIQWTSIREAQGNEFDREVRGASGVSHYQQWQKDRIWVPGPEFVGTLAEADVTGSEPDFLSNPRTAAIDVWYPTKQEFGLQGVVDKNHSIIHIVPRLAASRLCDTAGDEACTAVPTHPSLDSTYCACRDRYAADCSCTTVTPARYFRCSNSKKPCTRHAHCNPPNGLCNTQPTCQQAGKVWDDPSGTSSNTKCWTDAHCTDPAFPQCGYLLFNLHEQRETGEASILLERTLAGAGGRKRRGVCKTTSGTLRKACDNGSGNPACTAAEGPCTEYTLEALAGTKHTTTTSTSTSTSTTTP
jgi:hypothetical protein